MTISTLGRAAAVLSFGLLAAGAAQAVYRCGNVYQDTPCDSKGPQAHLTPGMKAKPAPAPGPSAATAASPFAAVCSRVGEAAQKFAWRREAGATQEAQVAELPANNSRQAMTEVIESVYRRRGSAPDIRAAIEAECVATKQKEADEAAVLRQLQSRQAAAAGPGPEPAAPAPDPRAARASISGADPKVNCPYWRRELQQLNANARRGGTAGQMEEWRNRERELEKQVRDTRC